MALAVRGIVEGRASILSIEGPLYAFSVNRE